MRLDDKTRKIIKSEAASQFGAEAIVRLFGSRVDDTQRGGDIDLLIDPIHPLAHRIQAECRLSARLYIKLGERKVDGRTIGVKLLGSQTIGVRFGLSFRGLAQVAQHIPPFSLIMQFEVPTFNLQTNE